MVDRYLDDQNCSSVVLDHWTGGYIATKHLIGLGRKSIACVTGPHGLADSQGRFEGYRYALSEADPF